VERGEVWWVELDEQRPVVLLSGGPGPEFRAVQIVAPATSAEKRGFVVMTGAQAADAEQRRQIIEAAGPDTAAIGVEVLLGAPEGLARDGVVRLALPRSGKIFCTWMLTLAEHDLVGRAGALSPAKLHELDVALELAAG
jgi:mRNA interferase MazF